MDVVERKAIELMEVDDEMLGLELERGGHESDVCVGVGNSYSNTSIISNISSNNQAQTTIFLGGESNQLTWLSLENCSGKRKRESENYDKNKRSRLVPQDSFSNDL